MIRSSLLCCAVYALFSCFCGPIFAADGPSLSPTSSRFALAPPTSNHAKILQETAQRIVVDSKILTGGITHEGSADPNPAVVHGGGQQVALGQSLSAILPKGWRVKYIEPDLEALPIGWSGKMDWVSVLTSIAYSHGLYFQIDWDQQVVSCSRSPIEVPKNTLVAPALAPMLLISKGELINEALDRWATQGGWNLIWYPAYSWQAVADVDMMRFGTDIAGAVGEVVRIMREEGVPIRLRISRANQVLEVISDEVKYED